MSGADMEYYCTWCAEPLDDYYTRNSRRFCDEDCADAWEDAE
jgi:hypothetical protein